MDRKLLNYSFQIGFFFIISDSLRIVKITIQAGYLTLLRRKEITLENIAFSRVMVLQRGLEPRKYDAARRLH